MKCTALQCNALYKHLFSYRNKVSAIWKFFTKVDLNKNKAVCNDCKTELACNGGTTSGLKNHLKSKHKDHYQQLSNATPMRQNTRQGMIWCLNNQR